LGVGHTMVHQIASVAVPRKLLPDDENSDIELTRLRAVLDDKDTSVADLFAVLRQWDEVVQENIGAVAHGLITRGCAVNDRDSITDMNMLHFACKAGAAGLRNELKVARVVSDLIDSGADVNAVCQWTKMTPLHYAAFFNASAVIDVLARKSKPDLNAPCAEFEGGTPLHLAAMAGAAESVSMLIKHGADAACGDSSARTALECASQISKMQGGDGTGDDIWRDIVAELSKVTPKGSARASSSSKARTKPPRGPGAAAAAAAASSAPANVATDNVDVIEVGVRVQVNGGNTGLVRFRGPVAFDRRDDWVGVQLDNADGKNNGVVAGVEYFRCKPRHGLFVRAKACKRLAVQPDGGGAGAGAGSNPPRTPSRSSSSSSTGIPRSSSRSSINSTPTRGGSKKTSMTPKSTPGKGTPGGNFGIGSKVFITKDGKMGIVKYVGSIDVAEGTFIGISLQDPAGKHDGELEGRRYFRSKPMHGVFCKPERCTWRGFKVSEVMK